MKNCEQISSTPFRKMTCHWVMCLLSSVVSTTYNRLTSSFSFIIYSSFSFKTAKQFLFEKIYHNVTKQLPRTSVLPTRSFDLIQNLHHWTNSIKLFSSPLILPHPDQTFQHSWFHKFLDRFDLNAKQITEYFAENGNVYEFLIEFKSFFFVGNKLEGKNNNLCIQVSSFKGANNRWKKQSCKSNKLRYSLWKRNDIKC